MAKRSEFKRVERDYYRTFDPKAGHALRPFVEEVKFALEPFAGAGDLTAQFPEIDWWETDIEPQTDHIGKRDAFTWLEKDIKKDRYFDCIISNPPWSRPILHRAIEHFAPIIPTWFLLDANWVWTKQASPYINKYLTDIVTIGRLKWIEGTTMSGKDDCAWFRFSIDKTEPTRFFGRE